MADFLGAHSRVMILEDDESLCKIVSNDFEEEGITEIDCLYNGDDAWNKLCEKKYDLLLLDWKVPGLSSLALINRIKSDPYYRHVPVIVMSGYLKEHDFALLGEYSNIGSVLKPFNSPLLFRKIKNVFAEASWYKNQEKKLTALVSKLKTPLPDNQANEIIRLTETSPNLIPLAIILGKTLRQSGFYDLASDILLRALRFSNDHIVLLSELGKIQLHRGDFTQARHYLTRAYQKSPQNIERLCDIGDSHLGDLDTDTAADFFSQASEIDERDEKASSGLLIANSMGKWLAGAVSVPDTFAGILNAAGISMVRSGAFEEGIEYYTAAMNHVLHDSLKSRLAFNIALGYLRWRRPDDALEWFRKSIGFHSENHKSNQYISRLISATPKKFRSNQDIDADADEMSGSQKSTTKHGPNEQQNNDPYSENYDSPLDTGEHEDKFEDDDDPMIDLI